MLESLRGRGRDRFDRRDPERGPRPRLLDLRRNGRLFDRLAALDFAYLLSLDFAAGQETLRLLLPQSVETPPLPRRSRRGLLPMLPPPR